MSYVFVRDNNGKKTRVTVSSVCTAEVLKTLQFFGAFHYTNSLSKVPRFDIGGNWHKGISLLPLVIGSYARTPVGESGFKTSVKIARKNDLSYDSISVGPYFFDYVMTYVSENDVVDNRTFFTKLMGSSRMKSIGTILSDLIDKSKYITLQEFINKVGVKFFTAYRNHHLMYEVLGDDRVYEKMRYSMDAVDRDLLKTTIMKQDDYAKYVAV